MQYIEDHSKLHNIYYDPIIGDEYSSAYRSVVKEAVYVA